MTVEILIIQKEAFEEMAAKFSRFTERVDAILAMPERLPVIGGKHTLYVRFLVENLAAQLIVGDYPGVAVVLQGAAAHFQPCRHLPVR